MVSFKEVNIWILDDDRLKKSHIPMLSLVFLLDNWKFTEIEQIFIKLILYQCFFLEDFIEMLGNINDFDNLTFWQVELNILEHSVYFRKLFGQVIFISLNIRMVLFLLLYLLLWNYLFLNFIDNRSSMFITFPLLGLDLF